jgi:polyisoprenoid-binding protein YceI
VRYRILPGKSRIECLATSKVHDTKVVTDRVTGEVIVGDDGRLERLLVEVDTRSLNAGDFLRNHEMHDYLETAKNPVARLTLEAPVPLGNGTVALAASLEFRGQRARYELRAQGDVSPTGARGRCRFVPRFTDFGLKPPKVLFLKMDDPVETQVHLEAEPVDP